MPSSLLCGLLPALEAQERGLRIGHRRARSRDALPLCSMDSYLLRNRRKEVIGSGTVGEGVVMPSLCALWTPTCSGIAGKRSSDLARSRDSLLCALWTPTCSGIAGKRSSDREPSGKDHSNQKIFEINFHRCRCPTSFLPSFVPWRLTTGRHAR